MRLPITLAALFLAQVTLAAECTQPPQLADTGAGWSGWGNGQGNTRHAPQGLTSEDLDRLQLRWAFGFPDTGSVVGNPVVRGDTLFIGVDSGAVYALDADSACVHWVFQADAGVRTAPAYGEVFGRSLLFFGDRNAQVYAVDAQSGALRWKTRVEDHQAAIITGSPQFIELDAERFRYRVIVPVSSSEEGIAAVPTYPCCTFRGSIVSLEADSGAEIWQTYTIAMPPQDRGDNRFGPSGAAVWSAPTLDPVNGRLYVTTGDAYSAPADAATDAVIAMDLEAGNIVWVNQGTPDDIWTVACMRPNAPADCGPDQDYGSPAMLLGTGADSFLVAGQKSGIVRAFEPGDGALRWQRALVENTTEFGGKIIWGGASDGTRAYFGLGTGGIAAVNLADGSLAWSTALLPSEGRERHVGHDGPLTHSGNLLFSGGWDGLLRILDSGSGAILWDYDTARPFPTVNGEQANGGSMGAAGPIVAGRRLFVPSGYVGVKNGMRGNVLLMFSP